MPRRCHVLPEIRPYRLVVNDTGDPERPPEGTTPLGLREASRVGM
jgi:hypothetical protein